MSSLTLHKTPSSFLNDQENPEKSGYQNFFELDVKYVRLIGKYPVSGLAKSIDVEAQVGRNIGFALRYPISAVGCPNILLVLRDAKTKQVIGSSELSTNFAFFIDDCKGKTNINISNAWSPSGAGAAYIDVYEDNLAEPIDELTPIYTSQVFDLGLNEDEAKEQGIIRQASLNPFSAGLTNLSEPTKQIGRIVAAGLVGYFVWTNRDVFNNSIRKVFGANS